jgi:integrase
MGIFKKGPSRYIIKARYRVRPADPRLEQIDRRVIEHFQGTQAQAEQRYLELRAKLRGDRAKVSTFGAVLETYKTSRGGEIPRSERSVFDTLMRDLGHIEIDSLEDKLRQYAVLIGRIPSKTTGLTLSNGSRNRQRAMASAALKLSIDLKDIPGPNPITDSVWPKLKEIPRDRRLTPEETARLMEVVRREAPHLEQIFWFALRVPCRKNELVKMRQPDLDLFNNAIRVYNGTTKNKTGVWKPIPDEMKAYFRSIPAACPFLFFRVVNGAYKSLGDFKTAWRRCLRLAGIVDFRFHDTRHISASNLVNAGMSERDVMKIAGWNTNMLGTYWGSSSQETLSRVKFLPGSVLVGGIEGAIKSEGEKTGGELREERAVL